MGEDHGAFLGQAARFAAALSLMFIGYGLIQPVISLYTSDFVGASYLLVGALISTIGLVKAAMGPVSGFLSDTYGRRRFALAGAASIAVSMATVAFAGSTLQLFLAFVLYGAGQALFFLALMTSMVDVARPGRRALSLGLYEGVNSFSILAGIALSGPMMAAFGARVTFGLAAAFSLASFLICVLLMGETADLRRPEGGVFDLGGLRRLVGPEYLTAMFSAFLFMYTNSLFMAIIPLYMTLTVQMTPEFLPTLFMGFSGTTAVASLIAGPVSDRVGRRTPMAVGMVVATASYSALLMIKTSVSLIVAGMTLGFGVGFFHPVASAMVADISTSENRGKAFGFYRLMRDLGTFAGPAVAGVVSALLGVDAIFVLSVCLSAAGAVLTIFVIKETLKKG
jgi:MFS family permease